MLQQTFGMLHNRILILIALSKMSQVLTCCVHRALCNFLDVLEELGLGSAWVPKQEHVDIAPETMGTRRVLLLAAKQRQSNACFDIEVAIDGGRYALAHALSCSTPHSHKYWTPGSAWVANQEHLNVAPKAVGAGGVLLMAA